MPVIVDTTVWIDFFRGETTTQTEMLETVVRRGDAALGDLIVSEVLQGVTNDREFRRVRREFGEFPVYAMVGARLAIQSAVNYRKLRARGITIRKAVDCWIATFCIERRFPLLHHDRDFDPFEKHLGLQTRI